MTSPKGIALNPLNLGNKFFENLLNKKQLAQKLSLSISMIDKLMAQGLPHYKLGKSVRFDLNDVAEFLKRRKFP